MGGKNEWFSNSLCGSYGVPILTNTRNRLSTCISGGGVMDDLGNDVEVALAGALPAEAFSADEDEGAAKRDCFKILSMGFSCAALF